MELLESPSRDTSMLVRTSWGGARLTRGPSTTPLQPNRLRPVRSWPHGSCATRSRCSTRFVAAQSG